MSKRKRIKDLEREIERMQQEDDRASDTLWRMFEVLCDEFNMKLEIRPREDEQA